MKRSTCPSCKNGFKADRESRVGRCTVCKGLGEIFHAEEEENLTLYEGKTKSIHIFKCSAKHIFYTDDVEVDASIVKNCPVCGLEVLGKPL